MPQGYTLTTSPKTGGDRDDSIAIPSITFTREQIFAAVLGVMLLARSNLAQPLLLMAWLYLFL